MTGVTLYPRESVIIFDEIQRQPLVRQAIKYLVADGTNRKLMRDFRIYMAVGGMPQAVEAFVEGKNFSEIDRVKREIINLYIDDFKKIDNSGLIGKMYESIPSQLATNKKRYMISRATGKRKTKKDVERMADLIDSKAVIAFGFDKINFNRIEIDCRTENEASRRVIEKCGLTYEGVFRDFFWRKDHFEGRRVFSILKNEWKKEN